MRKRSREPKERRPKVGLQSFFAQIGREKFLTAEEERAAAVRTEDGDPEARRLLIVTNLARVVQLAKQYRNRGLDLEDLIEEGVLGLVRAVEGFDPYLGMRFSTYATYWIIQAIQRSLRDKADTVRTPAYMMANLMDWAKAESTLTVALGRCPAEHEVARSLGYRQRDVRKVVTVIRDARRAHSAPRNTSISGGDEMPDLDLVQEGRQGPQEEVEILDQIAAIRDRMRFLCPQDALVLRHRFGLDGAEVLTLCQLGDRLNLTRERVRQIEARAIERLGGPKTGRNGHGGAFHIKSRKRNCG